MEVKEKQLLELGLEQDKMPEEDKKKILTALGSIKDKEMENLTEEECRKDIESDVDSEQLEVPINPLTGEKEGEPFAAEQEVSDEEVMRTIYAVTDKDNLKLPVEFRELLIEASGYTSEMVDKLEEKCRDFTLDKDIREFCSEDELNSIITDEVSDVMKDDTHEEKLNKKYDYLKWICDYIRINPDNVEDGGVLIKAMEFYKKEKGLTNRDMAKTLLPSLEMLTKVQKGTKLARTKCMINILKETPYIDILLNSLKNRGPFLSRGFMDDKQLTKVIHKFDKLSIANNINIPNLQYYGECVAHILKLTGVGEDILNVRNVRRVLYCIMRVATTKPDESLDKLAAVGEFINDIYKAIIDNRDNKSLGKCNEVSKNIIELIKVIQ